MKKKKRERKYDISGRTERPLRFPFERIPLIHSDEFLIYFVTPITFPFYCPYENILKNTTRIRLRIFFFFLF